jgi:transposase
MPKKLPTIHESQEELLTLFNTINDRERRNRVHALFLITIEHCRTRKAIAKTLHVERKAVERWLIQYEHEGLQALVRQHRNRCGRKPRIQGESLAQLREQLSRPEGFQGYQSICTWLHDRFGRDVPYKTVYHTVHSKLKGSPKVPRKSHVKKDATQEEAFKKKCLQTTSTQPNRRIPSSYR